MPSWRQICRLESGQSGNVQGNVEFVCLLNDLNNVFGGAARITRTINPQAKAAASGHRVAG